MAETDRPGPGIDKDYRKVIVTLIDEQGWRYDSSGQGYPRLFPPDKSKRAIAVPKTPGGGRGFKNWIAQIRRAGGRV
ncbi:MAG TPA: hypothetical protein VFF32_04310 [Dermatophilaceae bacterium]|nr:hypothetical protein [Dermatophilaceae bacterium]